MAVRGTSLRVGKINLGRSRLATDEIRRVAMEEGLDVLLLQEPYSIGGKIPGYGVKSKVVVGQGVPMAAVVIFSEELDCVVVGEATNSHCVVVEVVGEGVGRVVLVSAYFQFGDPVEGYLEWLEQKLRGLGEGMGRVLIGEWEI